MEGILTVSVDAYVTNPDTYNLYNNQNRKVVFDTSKGHPVDTGYQDETARIPPQKHY